MSRIRRHLTYSNVMITLLAFIVLGGGAYAAFHLPKNSVKSRNIKNGQVRKADLANRAVNSSKLNLVRFDQRASEIDITGGESQPLGPQVTLDVRTGGTVVFEATANIAKSANTAECVLEAVNDGSTQFLFQPAVGAGNPPEPFKSGLVPSHPVVSGRKTFQLEARLNGQTTETCSFDHVKFYGFALG